MFGKLMNVILLVMISVILVLQVRQSGTGYQAINMKDGRVAICRVTAKGGIQLQKVFDYRQQGSPQSQGARPQVQRAQEGERAPNVPVTANAVQPGPQVAGPQVGQ